MRYADYVCSSSFDKKAGHNVGITNGWAVSAE